MSLKRSSAAAGDSWHSCGGLDWKGGDSASRWGKGQRSRKKHATREPDDGVAREQKCAQCRKWEAEGEQHGKCFYCARCCAKWEQREAHVGAAEGGSSGEEQFLGPYRDHWRGLIELEWAEEQAVVEARMKWPLERLVSKGFCVPCLEGKKHGAFFGKSKVVFSKARGAGFLGKHQFTSGDEVVVSREHPTEKWAWKAEVLELGASKIVVVADDSSLPRDLRTGVWRLDCGANKTAYERTKAALGHVAGAKFSAGVADRASLRRLLLNEDGDELRTDLFECDLAGDTDEPRAQMNESQEAAIANVRRRSLGLIQGPPGTGKTTTTCRLIEKMVLDQRTRQGEGVDAKQRFRVLVAADSNVAVDQLLAGLVGFESLRVVRVGFPSKVSEQLREHTLLARAETHPSAAKIEETRDKLQQVKDDLYGGRLKGKGKGLAHRDISCCVRDIQQLEQHMHDDILFSADVVCATLIGCGCDALLQIKFDTVVIDEASQATEPRCLVAAQKALRQLVLVGDHQQLPPTVLCQNAQDQGLGVSLFERMLANESFGTLNMLRTQYRMHPLIREWPSKQFYGGGLLDGLSRSGGTREAPLWFIDTSRATAGGSLQSACVPALRGAAAGGTSAPANKELSYSDGSKYNPFEVLVAQCVLAQLQREGFCDIGVISPYSAQVAELKTVLLRGAEAEPGVARLEVKTVDGYQGREKDAIVLSCVRTAGLGFLTDYRRLNVAITRAKFRLVIIGHGENLRKDPVWASYLEFLAANAKH